MRKIDGRWVMRAEELIGRFRLNYNQTISEYEATRDRYGKKSYCSREKVKMRR